jgi:hypothetical protein
MSRAAANIHGRVLYAIVIRSFSFLPCSLCNQHFQCHRAAVRFGASVRSLSGNPLNDIDNFPLGWGVALESEQNGLTQDRPDCRKAQHLISVAYANRPKKFILHQAANLFRGPASRAPARIAGTAPAEPGMRRRMRRLPDLEGTRDRRVAGRDSSFYASSRVGATRARSELQLRVRCFGPY